MGGEYRRGEGEGGKRDLEKKVERGGEEGSGSGRKERKGIILWGGKGREKRGGTWKREGICQIV